jgi:ankyrin repeat protein
MLWDSIKRNSEHNVGLILGAAYPVDYALNSLGITPLHLAMCSSNANIINLIMTYNPNINAVDGVSYRFIIKV